MYSVSGFSMVFSSGHLSFHARTGQPQLGNHRARDWEALLIEERVCMRVGVFLR